MKIGVIGGAGVRTVIFINGLLKRYKKLSIDEVVLYDIDFEKRSVNYIHIENIDYLYDISEGEGEILERCYDIFSSIESLVVEEIKSFL